MISNIYYFSSRWLFSTNHKDIWILCLSFKILSFTLSLYFLGKAINLFFLRQIKLSHLKRKIAYIEFQRRNTHRLRTSVEAMKNSARTGASSASASSGFIYKHVEARAKANASRGICLKLLK